MAAHTFGRGGDHDLGAEDVREQASMAQQTLVQLLDDIDGTEAAETLTFALDGVTYEIDVNEENASKLRDAFAPYIVALLATESDFFLIPVSYTRIRV